MIYRNFLKKTYLARREFVDYWGEVRKPFTASAGLVILRVSKATSAEALKLLYEESVFLFNLHKLDVTLRVNRYPPPQRAVALMSNVTFDIPANYLHRKDGTVDFSALFSTPNPQSLMEEIVTTVQLFTGTACCRNIMRVKSEGCGVDDTFDCEVMKNLGGFRKLVFEFESPPLSKSNKSMPESLQAGEASRLQSQRDQFQSQCEKQKESTLESPEPVYGPAVQGAVQDAFGYTCYLEFYPRQHLAKEMIAKAGRILEEAARLAVGERAAVALPEIVETLKLL